MGGVRATPPTRRTRPTAVREPTTGDAPRHLVGARRRLARPRRTGGSAPCWVTHTVVGNGTAASIGGKFPALPGRTGQAAPDPYRAGRSPPAVAPMCPTGDVSPYPCRGEALPRPPAPPGAAIRGDACARSWVAGAVRSAGPAGRTGQAPPDPYRAGVTHRRQTPIPDRGWVRPPCRGEAPPRPPAPDGAAHARPIPACGDDHDRPPTGVRCGYTGPGGPDGSGSA